MSRLIDADKAIDAMAKLEQEDNEAYGVSIPECFDSDRAIEALNNIPTVQAVPLSVLYDLRDELQTEADRQSLITASDLNIAINRINAKIRQYEGSDTE